MLKRHVKDLPGNAPLQSAGAEAVDPGVIATVGNRLKLLRKTGAGECGQQTEQRGATGDCGQNTAPGKGALRQPSLPHRPTQAPSRRPFLRGGLSPATAAPLQVAAHRGPVMPRGDATRLHCAYISLMTLIRAALLAPLSLCLGLSAWAEEVSLDKLSSYINSLKNVEARFVQVNADGSIANGRIILQRPGRARFEYDPPDKNLVLASGSMVAIFDAKSNQPPEQYPLARTPLNLILAPKVDLSTAKMVVDHGEFEGATHVLAQDPKHPDYGTIELIFNEDPVALTAWIITDDIGNQTTVKLQGLQPGADYPPSLFSIDLETKRRVKN